MKQCGLLAALASIILATGMMSVPAVDAAPGVAHALAPPLIKKDTAQVLHTCRMIVIRGPAGPQMVPYPYPVPGPAPMHAPAPIIVTPPQAVAAPGPDAATLALLHQILNNQTNILSQLAAIKAAPGNCKPGCGDNGIIVVPADGGSPSVIPMPVPMPGVGPAPLPAPLPTPAPFALPPGAAPPIVLPPGSAPPIVLPGGSAPPFTLPGGSAPPFTLPGGSAPPVGAPPKGAPTMPPADGLSGNTPAPALTPQRFTVYTRYTMYEPSKRRFVYVFIPQARGVGNPNASAVRAALAPKLQSKR